MNMRNSFDPAPEMRKMMAKIQLTATPIRYAPASTAMKMAMRIAKAMPPSYSVVITGC